MQLKYVNYDEYKKKVFKEQPEIKEMYEALSFKYQLINALIDYRKKHNLTQTELAKRLGIKQQALSRFERGKINPRIDFIERILDFLGYTVVLKKKDT